MSRIDRIDKLNNFEIDKLNNFEIETFLELLI